MIPFIKESERDQGEWNRKAKDAVNALSRRLTQDGATAARPVAPRRGDMFYDWSLGFPVWFNGTDWTDATGTTA